MKMKRFNYIFLLFAALFCSCSETPQLGGDTEITLPTKPYIYLDAGISTRASLVNGTTLDGNFSVFGYTYDFNNKWSTYRVTAKPNVFATAPQPVELSNGGYKYSPMKEWEGGKYTFFAFYPSPSGNKYVTLVNTTPAIRYSVNTTDLKASMVDLMIDPTSHKDLTSASNGVNNGSYGGHHQTYVVHIFNLGNFIHILIILCNRSFDNIITSFSKLFWM